MILPASVGGNGSDVGLMRMTLDGGSHSRLDARPTRARLAPDASGYLSTSAAMQFLVWTPLGGGAVRDLNQQFVPGQAFDVSRDGTRVAWAAARAEVSYYSCDLPACASVKSVAASPRALGVIRITPGNTGIAFIDEARLNVWVQPFDSRPAYPLTSFRDPAIQDFDWSFYGKQLAIMRSEGRQDIVMIKRLR